MATLAYLLCLTFFVYLCALADISFLYYINRSLAELDSTLSSNRSTSVGSGTGLSPGDYRKAQMSLFLNRLKCYPLIFVLGWIPDSLTLLWILVSGKEAIGIRCIANASAGSTGWAMAAAYFYYQFYASEVGKLVSSQLGSSVSGRMMTEDMRIIILYSFIDIQCDNLSTAATTLSIRSFKSSLTSDFNVSTSSRVSSHFRSISRSFFRIYAMSYSSSFASVMH